jgi:hypothetical protein
MSLKAAPTILATLVPAGEAESSRTDAIEPPPLEASVGAVFDAMTLHVAVAIVVLKAEVPPAAVVSTTAATEPLV